ncbi:MAG: hypothetical protein IJI44_04525 [Erysipelotrichaceae bacterium]|nr:hypothetical protein [Erysipelotrichaceae bacterium]
MKKRNIRKILRSFVLIVFVLLLCVSCSKKKEEEAEVVEPVEEVQEPEEVPEEEIPEEVEEPVIEPEEVPEPEFYERAVIVFLGCTGEDRDLESILVRAVEKLHLDVVGGIDKKHIIYGKQGEENNVYLIVPEKDITLTIVSFPDINKIYYQGDKPVIFVENNDVMNIDAQFTAMKAGDKSEATPFYLGIDPSSNVLFVNDAIAQGVDDQSDYDIFDESELPDHASRFVYYLYHEAPGAADDLEDENYTVGSSGYMVLKDKLYVTFLISEAKNPDKSYRYAMRYDEQLKGMEYLISTDSEGKKWIEMGGE